MWPTSWHLASELQVPNLQFWISYSVSRFLCPLTYPFLTTHMINSSFSQSSVMSYIYRIVCLVKTAQNWFRFFPQDERWNLTLYQAQISIFTKTTPQTRRRRTRIAFYFYYTTYKQVWLKHLVYYPRHGNLTNVQISTKFYCPVYSDRGIRIGNRLH